MSKTAFVVGGSGSIGRRLIELLSDSKEFSRVVLLGRRTLDLPDLPPHVEQKVINFDEIDKFADDLKGFNVGFSTIGTKSTVGKELFYKVDHDYVVNTARLAKEGGTTEFMLVTAKSSDVNGNFLYTKTKGETERDVTAIGFEKLVIARPGFLDGPREGTLRFGILSKAMLSGMKYLGSSWGMTTTQCAKALLEGHLQPQKGVVIWSNAELIEQSKKFDARIE